jgi:hypothetical protein
MTDVTLRIHRTQTEGYSPADEPERMALHLQRAKLVHGLVDTLQLEVKNWGKTDDATHAYEDVTIMVDLATFVIPALVAIFKIWRRSKVISKVEVKKQDGTMVNILGASSQDVKAILETIGE